MTRSRIAVVVNKWWELDPVLFCLVSCYLSKEPLPWPRLTDHPRPRRNPATPVEPLPAAPRAVFPFPFADVEVWCISDLLEHLPDQSKWQSSTERKAERLPLVFSPPPALTIAVGTASSGETPSRNGAVVIGTRCFLHNSKPDGANPDSDWRTGPFDTIVNSTLTPDEFAAITTLDAALALNFLPVPLHPDPDPRILAD